MGNVFELNRKRVFSVQEAEELLLIVRRITDDASARVKGYLTALEAIRDSNAERARELEAKINKVVDEWQTKIEKLGAEGKGLWLVDFDCGTGYFCWKYPEEKLAHFHGYSEGYQRRRPIRETDGIKIQHPDALVGSEKLQPQKPDQPSLPEFV